MPLILPPLLKNISYTFTSADLVNSVPILISASFFNTLIFGTGLLGNGTIELQSQNSDGTWSNVASIAGNQTSVIDAASILGTPNSIPFNLRVIVLSKITTANSQTFMITYI
jgi:hypothetical protein